MRPIPSVRSFAAGFISCLAMIVAVGVFSKAVSCDWLVASVASHHYGPGSGKDYEQRNYGLGCEHRIRENLDFVAGFYRNSIRIDSTYVGVMWTAYRAGMFRLGTAATLVSGYQKEPVKALIPVVSVEGRTLGANLLIVPPTNANVGALGLQVKLRF
jgi:hypothetical protein